VAPVSELPDDASAELRARFARLPAKAQARVLAGLNEHRQARQHLLQIRRRGERRAPLTFGQQGLWFLQQIAPDSSMFNQCRVWAIDGALDVPALERALTEIVRRHEILRTRYIIEAYAPVQEVMPLAPIRIDVMRDEAPEAFRSRMASRPFDLTSPDALHCGLLHTGPNRFELAIARHHIATDGWSSAVFRRELSVLYGDFASGRPASLPELPLQYTDYALWQFEESRTPEVEGAIAAALAALADLPDPPSLEPGVERPRTASGLGGRVRGALDRDVVIALRDLAHRHDTTLFVALAAVFNTLVHHSTGCRDALVVTPIAGRVHADLEGLIGMFANELPLRTDLSGDPSFVDLLERVRGETLRVMARQHVPFQRLQGALRPGRARSRALLAPLVFALQNVPRRPLTLAGVHVEPVDSALDACAEDARFFTWELPDGALAIQIDYRADVFDESAVTRARDGFVALAHAIAAAPRSRLSALAAPGAGSLPG
jgi:hypothetical protein